MHRSRLALFAVVALVVLSGCTLPDSPDQFDTDRELGAVGDYTHDDVFEFDDTEAVTESQLEAVKYRSMARIEVLRGLKFKHDVELELITRDEYRSQRGEPESASVFTNELWRGAFIVDGETDVNHAMDNLYGGAVQGYYTNDRIVIIADDTDAVRIDRETLVHELVHALQDQHFGLERHGETIDEQRADLGLLEGEANYLPYLYDQRCGAEWQCVPADDGPAGEISPGERPFNAGLFLSIYTPYSEGPPFVAHLRERGGWDAVDRAYERYPASTSQLIHPERYPDDEPVAVEIPDRSSEDWVAYGPEGDPRTETIGEGTLFAALWANGVIDRSLTEGSTELSPYNYSHPATDGWVGDSFQVYLDTAEDDRTGYVWHLEWERSDDAEAFADAYRTLLENRGGAPVDAVDDAYRIPDSEPFGGAYRVTVSGDTVEIVGAPLAIDLEAVHASEANASAQGTVETTAPVTPGPASIPSAATASADG
ncbi:Hvo_1808 family surface protein [Natronorubrum bangense]|uniref:Lipoprotein n=2 Tax=Natronorubrum bangense TaxID=61858 RepID=L9WQN3_9EURY|nr:Hvo_1808 family surface protein [Natronorubrum bangense]ELY50638.1 hypothetical protein C494_04645 [Natronorubrum bangense JCM 10635]QCC54462.1 hypothetical protein DV706_08155 [Natronorubrum bangense]